MQGELYIIHNKDIIAYHKAYEMVKGKDRQGLGE